MITHLEGNTAYLQCECGNEFTYSPLPEEADLREIVLDSIGGGKCEQCREREKREAEEAKRRAYLEEVKRTLPERIAAIGIPAKLNLPEPPVRFVAEWLWNNRRSHILLSGATGAGKSTGAADVAKKLTERCAAKVRYYPTPRKLLSEWRAAKTSKQPLADEHFLLELSSLDVLIVDELINKATITQGGQEILYELIDGAYNGNRKTRIWFLGNFYRGSIQEIFTDPAPVLRRLRDVFTTAVIVNGTIRPIAIEEEE